MSKQTFRLEMEVGPSFVSKSQLYDGVFWFLLFRPVLLSAAKQFHLTESMTLMKSKNRQIHEFNRSIDKALVRPAALGYTSIVPDEIEDSVSNFSRNLSSPSIIVNSLLQGDLNGCRGWNVPLYNELYHWISWVI